MPVKNLGNVTPYEILFDSKPDYSYLRCFGCLCFASTSRQGRTKLEPRAHPCVFLGYPAATKGYKVLDLVTYKIFVSRDVKFHKKNFPFHMSKLPSMPITQFFFSTETSYDSYHCFDIPDVFYQSSSTSHYIPTSDNSDASISNSNTEILLRKSTRHIHKPSYFKDYICNLVSFTSLQKVYRALLIHTSSIREPTSYAQASTNPKWVQAMQLELKALESNNTWDLVDLPPKKKPIGCKSVSKTKLKADGSVKRFKARLVQVVFTTNVF